jgi:hypothetical protein
MPTHSKAIREYEILHDLSEAAGFLAVTAYVGLLAGVVFQLVVLIG